MTYDPKTVMPSFSQPAKPQTFTPKFDGKAKMNYAKFWEELNYKQGPKLIAIVASPESMFESMIDGNKKPFMEYGVHKQALRDASGKETYVELVCTAGRDRHSQKPCVGHWQADHYQKKPNTWRLSAKTKWMVVDLSWWKSVPRLDKDGNPVIIRDQMQFNIVPAQPDDEGAFFGRLMKLTLGSNHTKALFQIRQELYWTCSGCDTRIVTEKVICEKCNETLYDNLKAKPWDEVERLISTQHTCGKCGHTGVPIEGSDCGWKVVEGKDGKFRVPKPSCPLDAPVRMDLTNVFMEIQREGEKIESTIRKNGAFSIFEGTDSYPLGEASIEYLKDTFKMPEVAPSELIKQAIERNGGLFDLAQEIKDLMYPVETQAELFKVANPYGEAKLPTHSAPITQAVPAFVKKAEPMGIKFPNK
jgi:hypothetical protein